MRTFLPSASAVSSRLVKSPVERPQRWITANRVPSDRKSTRLNSSHLVISYAVFCLKKKKKTELVTSLLQNHTNSLSRISVECYFNQSVIATEYAHTLCHMSTLYPCARSQHLVYMP